MAVFVCPNCSHTQAAPDEYVGRTAKCLKCEAVGEITADKPIFSPAPRPAPPPEPAPVESKSTKTAAGNQSISYRTQFSLIIGLLVLLLAVQVFGMTSTKTSTTKWEYKIDSPSDISFASEMDSLGEQGWELVFARRATSEFGPVSYEVIFKRPKQ